MKICITLPYNKLTCIFDGFFFPATYVPMVQAPVMPVVMATAPVVSSSVKTGMLSEHFTAGDFTGVGQWSESFNLC